MSHGIASTDDFDPGKFRPHGRVQYEEQGRVLWSNATGPFNAELIDALTDLVKSTFPGMAAKGPWVNICLFRTSAMCSPEVLTIFTAMMKQIVALNLAPTGAAFILTPDVEGASVMGPLYEKCFQDAGIRYASFSSIEQACEWAASLIGPLDG